MAFQIWGTFTVCAKRYAPGSAPHIYIYIYIYMRFRCRVCAKGLRQRMLPWCSALACFCRSPCRRLCSSLAFSLGFAARCLDPSCRHFFAQRCVIIQQ